VSDDQLTKLVMLPAVKALAGKVGDITPEALEKGLKSVVSLGAGVATNALGTGVGLATNVTGKAVDTVKGIGGLFQSKTNEPQKGK
jgi:hypothetical protein